MKIRQILILSAMALTLGACSTIRKSTVSTAQVETHVVQYPTVADLEVLNKVEKTVVWSYNPFERDNMENIRQNLMYDLLKEVEADVLLEPQYNFVKVPYGERRLSVTGYPARFKSFRKATEADLEALKATHGADKGCCKDQKVYNVAQE